MTDDELLKAFKAGLLDPHSFTHETHLHVGWIYVCRYPLAEAVAKFKDRLQSWTSTTGADGKYHETITWFFMLIISERQSRCAAATFVAFLNLNVDLISKADPILMRYYSREVLASDHARKHYVLPDKLMDTEVA